MRYEELNWFDVEKYLENDDRLMIILGACEQHGYLSLTTDVKIPLALADAASKQTGVVMLPTLNFGCSPYFLEYPGTVSLRISTLLDVVEDIVRSVYRQGFRRILILNGHGGNEPVRARLYELVDQLEGLKVRWNSWWESHAIEEIARKFDLQPNHANWLEAFAFTQVCDLPEIKKVTAKSTGLMGASETRRVYGDGVFGDHYRVDDEIMDEIFQAALLDILFQLKME